MVDNRYTVHKQCNHEPPSDSDNNPSAPATRTSSSTTSDYTTATPKTQKNLYTECSAYTHPPSSTGGGQHKFNNRTNAANNAAKDKDVDIHKIGRFQYIVQMDQEMEIEPKPNVYRLHPPHSMPAATTATDRSPIDWLKLKAWTVRATPVARWTDEYSSSKRRSKLLRKCLVYVKWILAVLLALAAITSVVYVLSLDHHQEHGAVDVDAPTAFTVNPQRVIGRLPVIQSNGVDDGNRFNYKEKQLSRDIVEEFNYETSRSTRITEGFAIFIQTEAPPSAAHEDLSRRENISYSRPMKSFTKSAYETIPTRSTNYIREDVFKIENQDTLSPGASAKSSLFTSGHQNSFGIPIEEDEILMRILNKHLSDQHASVEQTSTTHQANYMTRVSPTLPNFRKSTVNSRDFRPTEEVHCQSTTLAVCRGILPYDLTTSRLRQLSATEEDHFGLLVQSECSAHAGAFMCSVLEPECRPSEMGVLQPCAGMCKDILRRCIHIISASEFLTNAFNCDQYPNATSAAVCRDSLEESEECHKDEFQCMDGSCIDKRNRCDQVNDCDQGEDERNCDYCAFNEYQCADTKVCIPGKWRCDQYDDCADASDETDCDEEQQTTTLKVASQTYRNPSTTYHAAPVKTRPPDTTTDQLFQSDMTKVMVLLNTNVPTAGDNKEIMMTSDTETESKLTRSTMASVYSAHMSPCPTDELRCMDGICIGQKHICDGIPDCSDGADEATCPAIL